MRVEVDYDKCQSLGVCESLAPQVFELQADGLHLLASEVTTADEPDVTDAVAACPSFALRLERDGDATSSLG
jgi:ferredoxin